MVLLQREKHAEGSGENSAKSRAKTRCAVLLVPSLRCFAFDPAVYITAYAIAYTLAMHCPVLTVLCGCQDYIFNLTNFSKKDSLYGMLCYLPTRNGLGFRVSGLGFRVLGISLSLSVCFIRGTNAGRFVPGDGSSAPPFTVHFVVLTPVAFVPGQGSYTMHFSVHFQHENDTVYFAHCYPYTYRDLQRIVLGVCYAMSGTDAAYRATRST
eukprot:3940947-Rhodomonas_salina.7